MTTEHHTQAGALQLRSVTKIYDAKQGQHRAVDSINLDIEAGKFVTFLGPSGCGRTLRKAKSPWTASPWCLSRPKSAPCRWCSSPTRSSHT